MCGGRARPTVSVPYREDGDMSGYTESYTTTFLPFDNSTLRARLAEMPVRSTSIESELRAVMAERRETETSRKKSKRSRWD